MVTFEVAQPLVLAAARSLGGEEVPLQESVGRALAKAVVSPSDMPRFSNSAVDGYAVSDADLEAGGAELKVAGTVAAGGKIGGLTVGPGVAVQVMTGAAVPPGTSAVVMQEDVDRDGASIVLREPLRAGRNVRVQGNEFRAGTVVAEDLTVVTPPVIGLLASLGLTSVRVRRRPSVGVLATGDELAQAGSELREAQIYESNSVALSAELDRLGFRYEVERVGDDEDATKRALTGLTERNEVVLTTGGVSVGQFDHVRGALCNLGFETVVPRVALKPGKPFCFMVRGSDGRVVFGLPGNPMSTLVTFSLFAWPFLLKASGLRPVGPLNARLAVAVEEAGDRTEFVPAAVEIVSGTLVASPWPPVGSHAVAGLSGADGLVMVPAGTGLAAGEMVVFFPLPWGRIQ